MILRITQLISRKFFLARVEMKVQEGIYFLHSSFIIQFIEEELANKDTGTTKLFKSLIFSKTINASNKLITTDLMTCDKTFEEIKKTHEIIIDSSGAYFDLIEEKSIKEDISDDDLYAIKVLNNNRVATVGAFFICANDKKRDIANLASGTGYTFKVLSPLDYGFD